MFGQRTHCNMDSSRLGARTQRLQGRNQLGQIPPMGLDGSGGHSIPWGGCNGIGHRREEQLEHVL
jgi:hypothetical protein